MSNFQIFIRQQKKQNRTREKMADSYKPFHDIYKSLRRLKPLIRVGKISSTDTLDVFCNRLNELLSSIECVSARQSISQLEKYRLAAMQLALHYEYLNIRMQHSTIVDGKASFKWIDQLNKIDGLLDTFAKYRLNSVVFFVYFKSLNLMVKTNFYQLKNIEATKQYLKIAEEMYGYLNENRLQLKEFYDFDQLFDKGSDLTPMRNGLKLLENFFMDHLEITEAIEEDEMSDTDFFTHALHSVHSQQHLCKIVPLIWIKKLLSLVPPLLTHRQYKNVSYFLVVASKVLEEHCRNNQQSNEIDTIRSSITTYWMHFVLGIFDSSKDTLLKKRAENEKSSLLFRNRFQLKHFIQQTITNKLDSSGDGVNTTLTLFNCFSQTIQLNENESLLCMDTLSDANDAKRLLTHSIDVIEKQIDCCDIVASPSNYVVHNYQLFDLLSIITTISEDASTCYAYQLRRLMKFNEMIDQLKERCFRIFKIISTQMLTDFNEVLFDLYATNYSRLFEEAEPRLQPTDNFVAAVEQKLIDLQEMNECLMSDNIDVKRQNSVQ